MQKLLFFSVIVSGAAMGFLMPSGSPKAPAPAAAPPPLIVPEKASSLADSPRKTVITRSPNGHFYADALVNDRSVRFVVDTGATAVALTMDDARKIGLDFSPEEFDVVGRGAGGDVRGKEVVIRHLAIGRQEAWDVRALILDEGLDTSLLGQTWLGAIDSVQINGDKLTLG